MQPSVLLLASLMAVAAPRAASLQMPLQPLKARAGVHTVRVSHPDDRPLQRKVSIAVGETLTFRVSLAEEAFPAGKD